MKRLSTLNLWFWAIFALVPAVLAFKQPEAPPLRDFDLRQPAAGKEKEFRQHKAAAIESLKKKLPKARVDLDEITGSPKFVTAGDGLLTGKEGKGRGVSAKSASAIPANDPHRALKAFLLEHKDLFGHGPEVLTAARISRDFVTAHNGLHTVVWEQQLDGIAVFRSTLVSHTTKDGELVNLSSHFIPDPAKAGDAGLKNRAALVAAPKINVRKAAALAVKSIGEETAEEELVVSKSDVGPEQKQKLKTAKLAGETEASLVWLPIDDKSMRLCWEIILTSKKRAETFEVLVDAETGVVWARYCLTSYISDASYRVFTSDSPTPMSPGYATPVTNQPSQVSRVLVVTNAVNTNASPNGWINDADNTTVGNNVDAHLDRISDNVPDSRPQGSPNRVFDFQPLDLTQDPSTYGDAAVVNLFYWCNWMHDKLYELGFTEATGNFQSDNFGRGGVGGDPIQADAQDGGFANDANYTPARDGLSGRIQMFKFTGSTPHRDSDLDAEVICHEYAHGLSNRRVGGGWVMLNLQSRGLGEGWSDFYSLALLSEATDDVNGNYGEGAYIGLGYYASPSFRENYYYGIRRFPYTTDLSKNPLTFNDIDTNQYDFHLSGAPSHIVNTDVTDVHNQGEVWCSALWEARANLIAKYGFQTGNHLILQIVTDAMDLTPQDPNFLQARDAIIQADQIDNDGANFWELWRAFAKRGMGFFASCPPSSTTAGVVESFALPDNLSVTPDAGLVSSGISGGPFLPGSQNYALTNIGTNALSWTVLTTSNWLAVNPAGGMLGALGNTNVNIAINSSLAATLPIGLYTNIVTFSNITSGINQTRAFILRIGQPDFYTEVFSVNDLDITNESFTFTPDGSISFYSVCRSTATNFPTDPNGGNVVTFTGGTLPPDDGWAQINLSTNVSLYGVSRTNFFVGSNGYLTFDSGDDRFDSSLSTHFSKLRVSALFRDLDPGTNNALVSWKQMSNRVAVTYQNVPLWGTDTTNNFQIELFFDGTIRLTYLNLAAKNGLVGLSRGTNTPAAFVESDFSAFPECAPRLVVEAPAVAIEGDGVLANAGKVTIPLPLATNLPINLYSSDSSKLAVPASVVLTNGQTNIFFNVTIVDNAVLDGSQTAVITAMVTNGSYLSGSANVLVHDNETAILSVNAPLEVNEADGLAQASITVSEPVAANVTVSLLSSDTTEISVPPKVTIPIGQTSVVFNVMVMQDNQIDGDQSATITAHVQNWTDGVGSIVVHDDEPTTLSVMLPTVAREGNATLPAAGRVKIAGTLATNLIVELSSEDASVITVPVSVTIPAGQTSAPFNITIIDDSVLDGTQTMQITADAPGFFSGVASMDILDDETPLPPLNPFPPHLSANNVVTIDLSWSPGLGEGAELLMNGGFETGDFTGWTRVPGTNGDFVINNGAFDPPSPDEPFSPYNGAFSAFGQETNAGKFSMFQDVAVPATAEVVTLSWVDRVHNFATDFATNQQFRVEIRDTNNVALSVVFSNQPGDAPFSDWTERKFNISNYRGQTIRLAFVVKNNPGLLEVQLDDVSIRAANPPSTTYDVYFGTDPNLTATNLLGSTTNTTWDLPLLQPLTTYHWQIVARRLGETNSPVWQFTTVPSLSISDATLAESNSGTTNVLLNVSLSAPSDQTVTADFATASNTADLGDYIATNGTVTFAPGETNQSISIEIRGDMTYERDETLFVNLSSPANAVIVDSQGVIAILNDDSFLTPIPNQTVNEGGTLTFTASAPTLNPVTTNVIANFENFSTTNASGTVMFRNPTFNLNTSGYMSGSRNLSLMTNVFPAGHSSTRVAGIFCAFNGTANEWLALSTDNATFLPNPTIDFEQVLQFDVYCDRDMRVGLGLSETGTTNVIGANGGISSSLEFVGVTNKTGSHPNATRLLTASNWYTLNFNIPYEPVTAFNGGNGVLQSSTGKGVLEHINFAPITNFSGNCDIYLDNFSVIYSNALTFSLSNAPPGATINPKTGVFAWTPTEAQGPGVYTMTISVVDNSQPPLTDSKTFSVTVNEVNIRPTLTVPLGVGASTNIVEGNLLTMNCTATDPDLPANILTFSLDPGAPAGASINPTNGVFTWRPAEAQGPGSYNFIIRVTDNGSPALNDSKSVTVNVSETNSAPILAAIPDRIVTYGTPISFVAAATDADVPANTLTYSLLAGAPAGAAINSTNGTFTWTPTQAQSPSTNTISIRVTDNGSPSLNDTKTFTVHVVNEPIFQSLSIAGQNLTLTWSAVPGQNYRVQFKTNLSDSVWSNLPGDVTAADVTATKDDSYDPISTRFYRLQVLP